jgi:hypothetical protein
MTRVAATASLIAALLVLPAHAQLARDMRLEDAGFKMREANTPERLARLRTLPPQKFVRREKNGVPYYLFADPDYCKCLFIGDQNALNTFRDMPKHPLQPDNVYAGRNQMVSEMVNDMNADAGFDTDTTDILHLNF